MEAGVVDPAKVTIYAVENLASAAGLALTTECLVTEIPAEKAGMRDKGDLLQRKWVWEWEACNCTGY